MLAFNIADDVFKISTDGSLNVLNNDSTVVESQSVSAININFDTPNKAANTANNFIPSVPDVAGRR